MRIPEARAEPCGFRARPLCGHATRQVDGCDIRVWNARLSSGACMPPRHLTAEICLDAIPIGVDHEGGVVVRAIVRAQAGRAIVGASSAEGSDMERIDGLTCGRGKAEVEV
jgi:hypothetical protein